jgi:hypothetical protein
VVQKLAMLLAFKSVPLAVIAVSFALGFITGILAYPLVRVSER